VFLAKTFAGTDLFPDQDCWRMVLKTNKYALQWGKYQVDQPLLSADSTTIM